MIEDTMYRIPGRRTDNRPYMEPKGCMIRSCWDIWLDAQKSSNDEVIAKGALKIQRRLAGKRLKFTLS
jgi:hypothetical protein